MGKAGVFMRRLRESSDHKYYKLTWNAFCDAFLQRYKPFDHIRRVRNQLINLRQGNDFQHLLNQVPAAEISEHEKMHYFIEGLHPDTRFQVIAKHCNTVLVAQKKRQTHVSKHINNNASKHQCNPHHPKLDTSPSKPQFVKNVFNEKSKLLCLRCRKTGHLASNFRVKLQPKQEKIMTAIHAYTAIDKHV